jgi:hypothetical protein
LYCLSHIADISSLQRCVIVLSFLTLDILVIRHHFVEISFQSDWSVTVKRFLLEQKLFIESMLTEIQEVE